MLQILNFLDSPKTQKSKFLEKETQNCNALRVIIWQKYFQVELSFKSLYSEFLHRTSQYKRISLK